VTILRRTGRQKDSTC